MEIRIIPYEDRKKYCSGLLFTDTKEHMVYGFFLKQLCFEDIARLVEVLKDFDMERYYNREITVQVGDINFEPVMGRTLQNK